MKTLVINGSPKKNGDTQALLDAFLSHLEGEVRVISAENGFAPCCDCRACWTKPGCAIRDGMQDVYDYLAGCDNVVLASPIWFSSLSGPLLDIASRMQTLFIGRFRRGEKHEPTKNGVLMLVGGQEKTKDAPIASAQVIMRTMGVKGPLTAIVTSLDTDHIPAKEDAQALSQARTAAMQLNELCNA